MRVRDGVRVRDRDEVRNGVRIRVRDGVGVRITSCPSHKEGLSAVHPIRRMGYQLSIPQGSCS